MSSFSNRRLSIDSAQKSGLWRPAGLLVLLLLMCGCGRESAEVERLPGVLNAMDWRPDSQLPVTLAAEWEVVWGTLVSPEAFDEVFQGDHFAIPGRWNAVTAAGMEGAFGVATFRLQVALLPYQGELALHLISPHSAWRLYVDGELVGQNGHPSANASEHTAHYVSRMMSMVPRSASLVLQVSNYTHAYGGPGHAPVLWQAQQLKAFLDGMSLYYVLVCGVLLTLGILHFTIYRSHGPVGHSRQAHLWFSLLCWVLVYRVVGVVPYIHLYFGDHWIYGDLRAVYASLFIAPIIYLMFFRNAFPEQFGLKRWLLLHPFLIAPLIYTLLASEFDYTLLRNYAIGANLVVVCLTTWACLRASADNEPGARIIFISNLLFLATSVNDALVYTDNGNGFDFTPLGILVLGIGYSFALRQRLQQTLLQATEATQNLERMNIELEDQVAERTQAYQAAAARAENSATEQARFIAAASHDLRQPLHALAMFTTAIRRKTQSTELASLVERQQTSITSLSDLLQDTLDTARLEAGTTQPEIRPVAVADLLQALVEDYQPKAESLGVTLTCAPTSGGLATDPSLLRRALGNLLDNAIKSAASQVVISADQQDTDWRFVVADDGPGIAEEDYERVFKPYVSLAESVTDGGYGLGLHVVNQFSRALHGRVELLRADIGGMQITIVLPSQEFESHLPNPPVDEQAQEIDVTNLNLENLRVLAVDDEPVVRDAIAALLGEWHCDVHVVATLSQAQAKIDAGLRPQILLVDYHLSGHTGLEVITALYGTLERSVPAIVITGATESSIHQRIAAAGYALLAKPIRSAELAQQLLSHAASSNGSDQPTTDREQR